MCLSLLGGDWIDQGYRNEGCCTPPGQATCPSSPFLKGLNAANVITACKKSVSPLTFFSFMYQKQDCQRRLPEGAQREESQPNREGCCPNDEPSRQSRHVRLNPKLDHGSTSSTDQKQHGCNPNSRHHTYTDFCGTAAGTGF